MAQQRKYRHEYKFLIDARYKEELYYRLKNIIPLDPHVGEEGSYWIRSVYFDDFADSCFRANEAGVNDRAKYRIRIYNASDERITLERKSKKNGMTCKESAPLTREQCDSMLDGIAPSLATPESEEYPELVRQFAVLMLTKAYRPKTIVEYEREPFIFEGGNVRITFDTNISAATEVRQFFEKSVPRYPVLAKGQMLMEVKYDEYFPGYLRNILDTGRLSQTSFSKYYLCRKYVSSRYKEGIYRA